MKGRFTWGELNGDSQTGMAHRHLTGRRLGPKVLHAVVASLDHPGTMGLNRYQFTFDPWKKGLRKILGDLEADVMEAIWALGQATVHDVHQRLADANRELAYTTVMTVMSRLAEKG